MNMTEQTIDTTMAATSIRVTTDTRDRLNAAGLRNESYDDIINRILDEREKKPEICLDCRYYVYDDKNSERDWCKHPLLSEPMGTTREAAPPKNCPLKK